MANLLCLDFDDTFVQDNTHRQLMARFADARGPEWERQVAGPRARGELTVEQSNARSLEFVSPDITDAEIAEYVLSVARVRPGAVELIDWAHWNGWQVTVVSLGYDLYVHPVLDSLGLDRVARHIGQTSTDYRRTLRYFSPRGIEVQSGFKLSYARAFHDAGDFVVYFGDGESDIEPARLAPVVFARSTLLEDLQGKHPAIHPFETFHNAIAVLEKEAEEWLRSFSSTTAAAV